MKKIAIIVFAFSLSACSSMDMQGVNPKDYYAQNPVKNTVATREQSLMLHFTGSMSLAAEDMHKLHAALKPISPLAADSIRFQLSDTDMKNEARKQALISMMYRMGYAKDKISFEPSDVLTRNEAHLVMAYLVVVPPDCPDWQMSPVTTYSNTVQANTRCAEETNIGLMVADPHDLLHGSGNSAPDTVRSVRAVQDYMNGKDYMPSTLGAGNGGAGGSSGSSSNSGGGGSASAGGSATGTAAASGSGSGSAVTPQ